MKKSLVCLCLSICSGLLMAQPANYDNEAIAILDRMSDQIGGLSSCSFTLVSSRDEKDFVFGSLKSFNTSEVFMSGPNKLLVNLNSQKGKRSYWYNGSQVVYYSFTENNYGIIEAPDNTIEMIEKLNEDYGVDWPAADFFYPTFTDDLMNYSDKITYLGKTLIEDKECHHIAAHNDAMDIELWISNDYTSLPVRFVINYRKDPQNVGQYEGVFSDWKMNPDLPESMFTFIPPSNASKLRILSRTEK